MSSFEDCWDQEQAEWLHYLPDFDTLVNTPRQMQDNSCLMQNDVAPLAGSQHTGTVVEPANLKMGASELQKWRHEPLSSGVPESEVEPNLEAHQEPPKDIIGVSIFGARHTGKRVSDYLMDNYQPGGSLPTSHITQRSRGHGDNYMTSPATLFGDKYGRDQSSGRYNVGVYRTSLSEVAPHRRYSKESDQNSVFRRTRQFFHRCVREKPNLNDLSSILSQQLPRPSVLEDVRYHPIDSHAYVARFPPSEDQSYRAVAVRQGQAARFQSHGDLSATMRNRMVEEPIANQWMYDKTRPQRTRDSFSIAHQVARQSASASREYYEEEEWEQDGRRCMANTPTERRLLLRALHPTILIALSALPEGEKVIEVDLRDTYHDIWHRIFDGHRKRGLHSAGSFQTLPRLEKWSGYIADFDLAGKGGNENTEIAIMTDPNREDKREAMTGGRLRFLLGAWIKAVENGWANDNIETPESAMLKIPDWVEVSLVDGVMHISDLGDVDGSGPIRR